METQFDAPLAAFSWQPNRRLHNATTGSRESKHTQLRALRAEKQSELKSNGSDEAQIWVSAIVGRAWRRMGKVFNVNPWQREREEKRREEKVRVGGLVGELKYQLSERLKLN